MEGTERGTWEKAYLPPLQKATPISVSNMSVPFLLAIDRVDTNSANLIASMKACWRFAIALSREIWGFASCTL